MTYIKPGFFLLFCFNCLFAQNNICFSEAPYNPDLPGLGMVNTICSDDFNADGLDDIATVDFSGYTIFFSTSTGSGFQPSDTLGNFGSFFSSVATGDLNNDGKPDVVATDQINNRIGICLAAGNGIFPALTFFTVGIAPAFVATGDFNHDGYSDMAVSNSGSNSISVLLSSSTGTFSVASYAVVNGPESLVCVDLNNDNKLDLVTTNGALTSILKGNGNGTFVMATNLNFGVNGLLSANLDADQKPDLAGFGSSSISTMKNMGNFMFALPVTFSTNIDPSCIASADFNNDGKQDLAIANSFFSPAGNYVAVFSNTSSGSFTNPLTYSVSAITFGRALCIKPIDLNNDQKLDLVVGRDNIYGLQTLINCNTVDVGILKQKAQASDFIVYPNPCNSTLTINLVLNTSGTSKDLFIYDTMYREIKHVEMENTTVKLDVSDLPNGLYYLVVSTYEKGQLARYFTVTH